jgi:hypothetical protein
MTFDEVLPAPEEASGPASDVAPSVFKRTLIAIIWASLNKDAGGWGGFSHEGLRT